MTDNQRAMLQNQQIDFVNSDSIDEDFFLQPYDKIRPIQNSEFQTWSPFDINLVRGLYQDKSQRKSLKSIRDTKDPLTQFLKEEFCNNIKAAGPVLRDDFT